jgi:hypothetical protein
VRAALIHVLIVVIVMASLCDQAAAQMLPHHTARPLIDRERIRAFADALPEELRLVVETLFDDYDEEVATRWEEYERAEREARAALDAAMAANPTADREMLSPRPEFGFHARMQAQRLFALSRLEEFIAEVRHVVSGNVANLAAWESLVRREWHARTLRYLDPAGQIVDLVESIKDLELSDAERAAIVPVIEEYLGGVGAVLEQFEGGFLELDDRMNLIRERLAAGDPAAIEERRKAGEWYWNLQREIVELNQRFRPQMSAALTVTNRQNWLVLLEAAMHRPLFEKSPVDAVVAALRDGDFIDGELKTGVELICVGYLEERDAARVRAAETLRRWAESDDFARASEVESSLHEAARNGDRSARPEMAYADNPIIPFLHRLLDIERRATRYLRSSLGADVIKSLPSHVRWLLAWDVGLDSN